MKEQFVTYEIAFKLKELGFDEECLAKYIDKKLYIGLIGNPYTSGLENIEAPLWQQAFDWFRKLEDWPFESYITPFLSSNPRQFEAKYWCRGLEVSVGVYNTYNEAQKNLLNKLIELCKNN